MSGKIKKIIRDFRTLGAEAARLFLEAPLYDAGIRVYGLGVRVAAIRNNKAALLSEGHRKVWEVLEGIRPSDRVIWFHAASLGEFEQGRPLMEEVRRRFPHFRILLTFFSPSGYEVRKNYDGADWVCYLPFDTPANARRFVERVRPEMAIFVKYEIWRNYLSRLWRMHVPTYLVSAVFRPEQRFFKKSGVWYREWLRWFTHIFVQDERSLSLLEGVGFRNVTVAGDTRFDRVKAIASQSCPVEELDIFCGGERGVRCHGRIFMAGSSWPADEDVYAPWLNLHPEVKAVVAPHEFDADRLVALKSIFKGGAVLLSEAKRNHALLHDAQVLIIDCFGLLSSAYRYADVAYVGGGFGVGIHNVNEAAVYAVPVLFGPNHSKFIEAGGLKECGGGIAVADRASFAEAADAMFGDSGECRRRGESAGHYIASCCGATRRIMDRLF